MYRQWTREAPLASCDKLFRSHANCSDGDGDRLLCFGACMPLVPPPCGGPTRLWSLESLECQKLMLKIFKNLNCSVSACSWGLRTPSRFFAHIFHTQLNLAHRLETARPDQPACQLLLQLAVAWPWLQLPVPITSEYRATLVNVPAAAATCPGSQQRL